MNLASQNNLMKKNTKIILIQFACLSICVKRGHLSCMEIDKLTISAVSNFLQLRSLHTKKSGKC